MNSHADIQKRLSAYCSGDLEAAEQARIEAHLAACPTCRADLVDIRTTLHLIRSTPHVDSPTWMTSRIMAHLREEKTAKRGWLQRLWFPQHTAFPVRILALLMVCVSGYYLSHTVETELRQTTQQQLQEIPAQPAPLPTQPLAQLPVTREKQGQPAAAKPQPAVPPSAAPQSAQRQESLPAPTPPYVPPSSATAPYAQAPPASKDQYGGKAESMNAAPAAGSYNLPLEAAPEKKMKSSRSHEQLSDAAAPAAAGRFAGAPAPQALPQATVRLNLVDPSAAPAMVREAVLRSGGSISDEQRPSLHRLKARIPAVQQKELLERLEKLGRIVERPVTPPAEAPLLEITIQW